LQIHTFGAFLSDGLLSLPLTCLFFILINTLFDFLQLWFFFELQSTNDLRTRNIVAFACYERDSVRIVAEIRLAVVMDYGLGCGSLSV
jgi:hypothetical protein